MGDKMSLLSGSNIEKLGKIEKKDLEVLKMCYKDYRESHHHEPISFEEFKELLLLGSWDNELPLIYGKNKKTL